MAVELLYHVKTTVKETLAAGVDATAPAGRVIVHDQFDGGVILNAGTTPAATNVAGWTRTIAGINEQIDLTALQGTGGGTVDHTGLKVRAITVRNRGTNAIILGQGVTNGYPLAGTSWKMTVAAGATLSYYANNGASAVGASAKLINAFGTIADVYDVLIVFG